MDVDILLKGGTIVTVNNSREIIEDGAIAITGDSISAIGTTQEVNKLVTNVKKEIDLHGKAVFPGLINTHNHLFQTLLKGMGDDKVLADWLATMTAPSAIHLNEKDVEMATYLGSLDCIRSGATTMVEYMYPHPKVNLSQPIIDTFLKIGIRAVFGRGMMTTGKQFGIPEEIMQKEEDAMNDFKKLHQQYHNKNGLIKVWLAPAAVWSNTCKMFKLIKDLMGEYDTGLSVHISETPFDRRASEMLHGCNDIEFLEKNSLLGPRTLMVHCVHLTKREIRLTKATKTAVSHNPVSNMYLSSGVAPIPDLVERGVAVGVATDGAASNNTNDMLEVLKTTALLHKVNSLDPTVITAERVLEMATIDGARAIGMENEIGSLEVGKKADLFVFNPLISARSVPMHNPVSTLIYSGSSINVETVIINGKCIVEDFVFNNLNERLVLEEANRQAMDLVDRAQLRKNGGRSWRSIAY
ncbi:MAG: amidohydrolase [Bacillota bacterium]